MKTKLRLFLALCAVLIVSGAAGVVTRTSAQNPSGQPEGEIGILAETLFAGVPAYSVMKTENGFLGLGVAVPVNAFVPATIPCPATAGAAGCTFRVTVTSQFRDLPPNAATMNLLITGPGTLGPAPLVNVAADTDAFWYETHSMQWVKKNIPAGTNPTVTVQFAMTFGNGDAAYRTLSIDVFNGLL